MVQEAWLRWSGRRVDEDVDVAARLPGDARHAPVPQRARLREEPARGEPRRPPARAGELDEGGIGRVDMLDRISMAFLVVLQRLTPAERAVLLLRDVFDFDYKEIAALVGKNEPACRKLLERAREHVATEKRLFSASPEAHQRLLMAFTGRARRRRRSARQSAGRGRRDDHRWRPRRPARRRQAQPARAAHGAARIAAFVAATSRRGGHFAIEIHELNGQPAIVFYEGERHSARCCSRSPTTASIASSSTETSTASVISDRHDSRGRSDGDRATAARL